MFLHKSPPLAPYLPPFYESIGTKIFVPYSKFTQMAVSISFFMVYSQAKIASERLHEHPVSIRAQVRYTRSHLNWSAAKRLGHTIHRIQFTTPVKAQPRWWKDGRVRHNHPNAAHINQTLDAIAERATAAHARYIADGAFPSDTDFIAAMLGAKEATRTPATFADYYRLYIAYLTDRNVSRSTVERHKYIIGVLERFAAATAYPLTFEAINKTFSARFTAWSVRSLPQRRATQNLENTVQRYLKDLRNFLSHAHTEGWTSVVTWRQIKPRFPRNTFPITVTDDEIRRIAALSADDFQKRYRGSAENVLISRDWFILGTQTAMRWSDWRNRAFRFVPVSEGFDLQFTQEKTDDPLQIPLSPLAIEVLERHQFEMPAPFSPAATLAHLRQIAAAAGIQKHITTHTARRTFCTLQEAAGVPRAVIMRITGHKTEKDYLRYTGITFRFNADMLRKANPAMFKTAG